MPIAMRWYDDSHTIIYCEVFEKLTIEDMNQIADEHNALAETVNHTVHFIIDWLHCEGVPSNVLTHARGLLLNRQHPRSGITLLVGMRFELRIFWGAFERAFRYLIKSPKFLMAESLEKGYPLLLQSIRGAA
ncbi:MAG: hypothetical protein U0694_25220 [Anaerolineae bacterium]